MARRNHSPAFKAKVALAALKGVPDVFDDKPKAPSEPEVDVKSLHAKIGQLTLENDFLGEAFGKAGLLGSVKN